MNKISVLKKKHIIGLVIILVIIVNLVFWYWLGQNQTYPLNDNDTQSYKDELIEFNVPQDFLQVESLVGITWSSTSSDSVAVFYDVFARDKDLNLDSQFNINVLNGQSCPSKSELEKFTIYYDCQYLGSVFTIINFEKDNQLVALGFNHQYLAKQEINSFIATIKK